MKNLLLIFTVLVSTVIFSSSSFAEKLILKCESYKYWGNDSVGHIFFVKIDFKTSEVLMKEPADDTIEGWILHKLMHSSENDFIIRQCRKSPCEGDKDNYDQIDRTTGRLKRFVSNKILKKQPFDGWTKFLEWKCKRSDRLF